MLLLLLLQLLLLRPGCSFGFSPLLCVTDDLVRHGELDQRPHGGECGVCECWTVAGGEKLLADTHAPDIASIVIYE
jgi:hypothetical protein